MMLRDPLRGLAARPWLAIGALGVLAVTAALPVLVDARSPADARSQQRDSASAAAPERGSASIVGVVIDDQLNTPVRRAVVTLRGSGPPPARSAVTDDEGRFAFRNLPAGRYAATAMKSAFLESAYGARRPGRPGTAIHIEAGQQLDVAIRLARGAVIEGVIRDEAGEPVPGITVYAFDPRDPGAIGSPMSRRERTATTDDRGVYRFFGVPAGDYVLAAMLTPVGEGEIARPSEAEVDAMLNRLGRRSDPSSRSGPMVPAPASAPVVAYAPSYYPGVSIFSRATHISVRVGDERLGMDFSVGATRTFTLEGTIAVSSGHAPVGVQLSLLPDGPRVFSGSSSPILVQPPDESGRFRYTNLAPGHYTILARSDPAAAARRTATAAEGRGSVAIASPPATGQQFGAVDVDVFADHVSGVSLVLQPAVRVSGRVVFEAAELSPPDDLSVVRIFASPPGGGWSSSRAGTRMGNALASPPSAHPRADGTFAIDGVAPGSYQFGAVFQADVNRQWWLRSAVVGDRDLLDEPLVVRLEDIDGIVVTYTDQRTGITGVLQNAGGLPAPEYFVVAFPGDRALWQSGSRRLKSARPATDGRFTMIELPAGRYLLAALTDFDPSDFEDRVFLEELAEQSIPVVVRAGEQTVQDVRIAR